MTAATPASRGLSMILACGVVSDHAASRIGKMTIPPIRLADPAVLARFIDLSTDRAVRSDVERVPADGRGAPWIR